MPTACRAVILSLILLLSGCPTHQKDLDAASDAFAARDYRRTIDQTQKTLAAPNLAREDAAAALYLQGRAYEEANASGEAEKLANLAAARRAYVDALSRGPSAGLEGRIHGGLANVAYHQEDYETALSQWTSAYDKIDLPDQKPWILYRIGLSQQRLGRFDQADRTLADVQKNFPGTEPARRAKEKQGTRQFYVQVAVFSQASLAGKTVDSLKRMGQLPLQSLDSQGRTVISVGPTANWAAARQLQMRISPQYPDALIVP